MHCAKSVRIRSYSVRMRENADQNNSEYGHFLRSDDIQRLTFPKKNALINKKYDANLIIRKMI